MSKDRIDNNAKLYQEYFRQAMIWYESKYILQITHRSLIFVICIISSFLIIFGAFNIYLLLPLSKSVKYAIYIDNNSNKINTAWIQKAEYYPDDPLASIQRVIIKNYIQYYERYSKSLFKHDSAYIKNTSTRLIHEQFIKNHEYLEYDKYQGERKIIVENVEITSDTTAKIHFTSKGFDSSKNNVEHTKWVTYISFRSDKINKNVKHNANFVFVVSSYKSELIQNNMKVG